MIPSNLTLPRMNLPILSPINNIEYNLDTSSKIILSDENIDLTFSVTENIVDINGNEDDSHKHIVFSGSSTETFDMNDLSNESLASVEDVSQPIINNQLVTSLNSSNSSPENPNYDTTPKGIIDAMNYEKKFVPPAINTVIAPIVPKPPLIIKVPLPPIKGPYIDNKNYKQNITDETSGLSLDLSITNPASLPSDFSSQTDKSIRNKKKRINLNEEFRGLGALKK
jgi:hypothetical protein